MEEQKKKILLVEDDPNFGTVLKDYLMMNDYDVMPEGRVMDQSFGSRHRAAMGITEETDAVVVIVSEERGTISFCFNGNIATNLDGPKLHAMLEAIFSPKVRKSARKVKRPEAGEAPASRREVEATPAPDSEHRRISLIADPDPSRRLRPPSDPPAPLRASTASTSTPPPAADVEESEPTSPAPEEPLRDSTRKGDP
jgi:hypothetical protein